MEFLSFPITLCYKSFILRKESARNSLCTDCELCYMIFIKVNSESYEHGENWFSNIEPSLTMLFLKCSVILGDNLLGIEIPAKCIFYFRIKLFVALNDGS